MTGYQKFSATRVADRAPSAPKGDAELIGRRIFLDGLGALGEISLQSPSWGYRKFIANGNSDDAPFPPKPPKVPAGEVGSQPSLDGLGALGGVPAQSRFLAPSDAAIHWEAEDWRTVLR